MKATRIIATTTALAIGTSVLATPAQAATTTSKPVMPIAVKITPVDKVNTCFFSTQEGIAGQDSILSVAKRYHDLMDSIRRSIRAGLPADKALFSRADAITGTDAIAKQGSVSSPELSAIIAKVSADMIAQGFRASEVHFAFWHSPQGDAFAKSLDVAALDVLPPMTRVEAENTLARQSDDADSITSIASRFFHAVGKVRIFVSTLADASIALLNRIDDAKVTSLKQSVKNTTETIPAVIEKQLRTAVRTCVSRQRLTSFYDLSSNPTKLSDDATLSSKDDTGHPQRGNFWSASSEVANGEGLSSVGEIKTALTEGLSSNSDQDGGEGWKKKASTILFIVGGLVTVVTALMRFSKLFTAVAGIATGKIKVTDAAAQAKKS